MNALGRPDYYDEVLEIDPGDAVPVNKLYSQVDGQGPARRSMLDGQLS